MSSNRLRLAELDGLRAIAALSVVLYHYLSHWSYLFPPAKALIPIADYGKYGVHLFFIISGFVISRSLLSCPSLVEFARRRLVRLWPAMIVCSLLTFAVLWSVDTPFTRMRRNDWTSFLPSWTFIEPWVWKRILPVGGWIDGVYWTLFVELKFYVLAGVAYFILGQRRFVLFFLAILVTGLLAEYLVPVGVPGAFLFDQVFLPTYMPFFGAGIALANLHRGDRSVLTLGLGVLAALACLLEMPGVGTRLMMSVLLLTFVLLIFRRSWVQWLAWPPLAWVGIVSYPVYLLHQNIGVAILSMLPASVPGQIFYPSLTLVIIGVVLLAGLVHNFVERPAQQRFGRSPRHRAAAV